MKEFILHRIWKYEKCKSLLKEGETCSNSGDWKCITCESCVKKIHHEIFEVENVEG